jgi:Flp pilus assembly protein TadG
MAFLMPIMIILLGAIGEFGRYFHMRSTLLRATRTGAGYMWDKANDTAGLERQKAIRMALCGQTTACTVASELIYPGLTEANFNVNIATEASGKYVTVSTVNAMYVPVFRMTALTGSSLPWGAMAINVNTRMRYTQ